MKITSEGHHDMMAISQTPHKISLEVVSWHGILYLVMEH